MNKRNFNLSAVFILLIASFAFSQKMPRGKKLYDLIIKRNLVTGGYATWLPDGSCFTFQRLNRRQNVLAGGRFISTIQMAL